MTCVLRPALRTTPCGPSPSAPPRSGSSAARSGTFAVLRRQSLLGDAISHAALPGIALAFLLTSSKAPLVLLAGRGHRRLARRRSLVMASCGRRGSSTTARSGIVLSVFFGFGLVLLTFIQRRPDASQAGLDKFLFGQAATLLEQRRRHDGRPGRGRAAGDCCCSGRSSSCSASTPTSAATLGFPMRAARRAADHAARRRDRGRAADGRRGADERDGGRPGGGGPAVDRPAGRDGRRWRRCSGRSPGVSGGGLSAARPRTADRADDRARASARSSALSLLLRANARPASAHRVARAPQPAPTARSTRSWPTSTSSAEQHEGSDHAPRGWQCWRRMSAAAPASAARAWRSSKRRGLGRGDAGY